MCSMGAKPIADAPATVMGRAPAAAGAPYAPILPSLAPGTPASGQGLVHQVAHELAIAQADEARRGRHEDHAQFLLGIHPEVGAVHPRPIVITGAAGHGR